MTMTTYTIKNRKCSNAYGECFEVWQDDVCFIGTFTRRFWAEAWIADMLAGIESSGCTHRSARRGDGR